MGVSPAHKVRAISPDALQFPAPASRLPSVAPILLITLIAAVLRFVDIGTQGFWFDEGNTALLVHLSPGKMLGLIPHQESTPPLYYCVLWVWARIFGYSEAGLRSFSALAGVAAVPVLYVASERLVSRRAALCVAALAACNPILIWYSQEARSYSLLVFMSTLTLLGFALALEHPTARRLGLWAVVCFLAIATHYYAVLVIAPEAAWLIWRYRTDRRFQVALGALVLAGCALLPYAIQQNNSGRVKWISTVALSRRLGQVVPQFVVGFGGPLNSVLEPLAVTLVAVAAAIAAASIGRADARELTGARAAFAIALAGLILNLLLIAAGIDDLISRNVLALWGAGAIGVGSAYAWRRLGLAGLAAVAALCAIGVAVVIDVDTNTNLQRPDWRVVARALGPAGAGPIPGKPGWYSYPPPAFGSGRIVLIQHYRDLLPLSLYEHGLMAMHGRRAFVSQIDVVSFTDPKTPGFCWWGSACNLWPSVAQTSWSIPGFHVDSIAHVNQFTVVRLGAASPLWVTRAELRAALTETRLPNDDPLFQRG